MSWFFSRGPTVRPRVNEIHNEQTWSESELQFARLLCELRPSLTPRQLKGAAKRMGVQVDNVEELLWRAKERWGKAVSRTDNQGYMPDIEVREYLLDEMSLYDPNTTPDALDLAAYVAYQMQFSFDYEQGGAIIDIDPEQIDLDAPRSIQIVISVQQGLPQIFVSTPTSSKLLISLNGEGEAVLLEMEEMGNDRVEP